MIEEILNNYDFIENEVDLSRLRNEKDERWDNDIVPPSIADYIEVEEQLIEGETNEKK